MYYKKGHDTANMTPVDDDLMMKMLSVLSPDLVLTWISANFSPKYLIYNIVTFDSQPT